MDSSEKMVWRCLDLFLDRTFLVFVIIWILKDAITDAFISGLKQQLVEELNAIG